MNCKLIIAKAIDEYKNQKTTYLSYFKREAKIADRDDFIEFADFFNGCKSAIYDYKKNIENQYYKRFTENDLVLSAYKKLLNDGQTVDQNGKPIQEHIDYIENEKKFIKERGYENNYDYYCLLSEYGELAESIYEMNYRLNYSDIQNLEQIVIQAELELTVKTQNKSEVQSKIIPQKRNINVDNLKLYFVSNFKGMGNGPINYFDMLIDELRTDRTAKEFAQIALLIFESDKLNNRKPNCFSKWLRIFYSDIDVLYVNYKPSKLKNENKKIRKLFSYLS